MLNSISEFSVEEESALLQYIVRNNKYRELQDERFWRQLETLGITRSTWRSSKEHFENQIIHKLKCPYFKLDAEQIENILKYANTKYKILEDDATAPPAEGKKVIVVTRKKHSTNVYPDYKKLGHRRILVSRNQGLDIKYAEPNLINPNKTILASLCTGRKKEVFVVRPKDEEPLGLYHESATPNTNPPKRLICFSHNVL